MHAEHTVMIHAPIQVVWQVLTEIDRWPEWQKAVSAASLQGAVAPSTEFLWTSGGMKIRSRIVEVSAPTSIRWLGSTLGTSADHAWTLTSFGADTRVATTERMSGWLVAVMGVFSKDFLANALKQTLEELKTEAERRHRG